MRNTAGLCNRCKSGVETELMFHVEHNTAEPQPKLRDRDLKNRVIGESSHRVIRNPEDPVFHVEHCLLTILILRVLDSHFMGICRFLLGPQPQNLASNDHVSAHFYSLGSHQQDSGVAAWDSNRVVPSELMS